MLKFTFTDINDNEIIMTKVIALTINIEEDVPCDDMIAVFEYMPVEELKTVSVTSMDRCIFKGVVDEQQITYSDNKCLLRLICRSMAARLLDSESVPVSYTNPSLKVIAQNHVLPFSLSCDLSNDKTYFGNLVVSKGDSNYKVLENFCLNTYHKKPRVNTQGQVVINNNTDSDTVVFSNDSDEYKYSDFTICNKRCEEISQVKVKLTNSGGYTTIVANDDALSRGVSAVRYVNAVLNDTPLTCAQLMIENGRKNSFYITLSCIGERLSAFLKPAEFVSSFGKNYKDLYVSAVRYKLCCDNEVTMITLKRRDDDNVAA